MNIDITFSGCSGAPTPTFVMQRIRIGAPKIVAAGSGICKDVAADPTFANIVRSPLFPFLKMKPRSYGIRS
jgi:hypothetical protein